MHDEVAEVLAGRRQWCVLHADALDVLPTLGDGVVDAVLADPPYGVTRCAWDSVIPLAPLWAELRRVIKPRGVVALTAGQPFTATLVTSNREWFRHEWVWIKNRGSNFANTVREPMKEHESVVVFSPGAWTYNPQPQARTGGGLSRTNYSIGERRHSDCYGDMPRAGEWTENRVPSSWQKFNCEVGLHPTQKPVALMEYLVRTYSNRGELILDFCCGSGTTLLAALKTGRRAVGIDNDPLHFETARKRLEEASGQTGLFAGLPAQPLLFPEAQ